MTNSRQNLEQHYYVERQKLNPSIDPYLSIPALFGNLQWLNYKSVIHLKHSKIKMMSILDKRLTKMNVIPTFSREE